MYLYFFIVLLSVNVPLKGKFKLKEELLQLPILWIFIFAYDEAADKTMRRHLIIIIEAVSWNCVKCIIHLSSLFHPMFYHNTFEVIFCLLSFK